MVLKESYVGNLSRGFSVTHEIDATSVVAKPENGVLNIALPKLEGGGRSIAVE